MNVMTEEEARGKGCPFMRFNPTCSASKCMAWRWGPRTEQRRPAGPDNAAPPDGEGWELFGGFGSPYGDEPHWWRMVDERGYCGIAGRPTP